MRRGLLGKGALLTVTSQAARTSPVTRGKWFLQTFLGVSPPDPPPDVPALKERAADTDRQHEDADDAADAWSCIARNPTCATCHKIFEPIGLALENFDAVGAWRTQDEGNPIDATGVLVDGTKVDGVGEPARRRWCSYPDQFVRVVTEKLLTYALGRGVEYQDMPLVRSIVRDAAAEQLPVLVARAGHRQERRVPDEHEGRATAPTAARGSLIAREDIIMFITKKHISRRTVLRGAGATLALPLLDAMVPAATALAQTAATPKPRFVGCFVPHGMAPGLLGARQSEGALDAELPFNWKPLEPFRESDGDPERPAFALGRAAAGRDRRRPLGGRGVPVREQAEEDRRRRRLRRHDDRPDHRAEDRPGQPAAVDAARGRGSGRELEQLRRGLQLRLHEHDLVGVADVAAADGAESAGGVRAHVRRRQHGRAARRAAQARPQHPRFADRQPARACAARSARRIARGSTSTPRTSARSSAGCRSR